MWISYNRTIIIPRPISLLLQHIKRMMMVVLRLEPMVVPHGTFRRCPHGHAHMAMTMMSHSQNRHGHHRRVRNRHRDLEMPISMAVSVGVTAGSAKLVEALWYRGRREKLVRRRGALGGQPLHPLQVEAVLLQVASDVLACQSLNIHQLHNRLRHGVFDPQMADDVDEPLVEMRGPHKAGPLQRPCGGVVAGIINRECGIGLLGAVHDLPRLPRIGSGTVTIVLVGLHHRRLVALA